LRALVVGYGSIGARHARLLSELGCATAVVSARAIDFTPCHRDLAAAVSLHRPDYVVIANATADHDATLSALVASGFAGTILVEKPLLARPRELPARAAGQTFVAYNLRFHPLLARVRDVLRTERVLSAQAYAGQFLPGWRPQTDYRTSYSARSEAGGGVLRDLSHELDYLTWLFGGWTAVTALGGHLSSLEIASDDVFALLLATPRCPVVTLELNYLDRVGRRSLVINTDQHTLALDFGAGTFALDGVREAFVVARDDTYRDMHRAALAGVGDPLCTLDEGAEVVRLIDAAERAAGTRTWLQR
jgi:predicted dehydrogenase